MFSVRSSRFVAAAVAVAVLILAACGSGGATNRPTPTATAAAPASASAPGTPATGSTIAVAGVEYSFQGIPASVKAGSTLTFKNDGTEMHEMVVIRRNAGVTKPFMAILGEGEAAARSQVTVLGVAVAVPGTAAPNSVTVDVAGDYALVCFIPVGTKPGGPTGAGGPPHFVQGMLAEFTVTN
jgi:plastocyanin